MTTSGSTVVLETDALEVAQPSAGEGVRLHPLDWRVSRGELWVVVGPQGSGKTALLETLAGLQPAAGGGVRVFGRAVHGLGDDEASLRETRRRMGLVFDGDGRLFSGLSVAENLLLPRCYHRNEGPSEALTALEPLIRHLQLGSLLSRSPASLGRSWSRRVALGRCLALGPGLLLLDNPLAGLDAAHLRWWRGFLAEALAGHPVLGSEPLAVVATTDAVRPYLALDPRFALVEGGRWRILPGLDPVLAATGEDGPPQPR
jgi:ABC-type transporter Mla maintaining outer membrane lipid asymmetry ATPase subunit MlaF